MSSCKKAYIKVLGFRSWHQWAVDLGLHPSRPLPVSMFIIHTLADLILRFSFIYNLWSPNEAWVKTFIPQNIHSHNQNIHVKSINKTHTWDSFYIQGSFLSQYSALKTCMRLCPPKMTSPLSQASSITTTNICQRSGGSLFLVLSPHSNSTFLQARIGNIFWSSPAWILLLSWECHAASTPIPRAQWF